MINRSHVKCFIIEGNQIKKTDLGGLLRKNYRKKISTMCNNHRLLYLQSFFRNSLSGSFGGNHIIHVYIIW